VTHLQAEGHVVPCGHVRVQRVALEDHGDVAVLRGEVVDDPLADPHAPVRDLLEPRDHAQRRRLATAGGPDEDDELPVLDLEVEPVHGLRPVGIDLRELLERDAGHA
jgi:hypothetical protein